MTGGLAPSTSSPDECSLYAQRAQMDGKVRKQGATSGREHHDISPPQIPASGCGGRCIAGHASHLARAQAYPSRPARIIVGFPAGGATDIQARLMGQWLSDRLGQQFIIENRAGASGNIGTEAVARAAPDGYTLLQIVTPHAINAALYTNLSFDFMRDIAPVVCSARLGYVVVVNPSVPVKTIPEFIAYAKANPGKINYGSAGPGTPQNIACELFKMMAGVNLVHVPYRGGAPAITDLIGGQIQLIFAPLSESIQQVKAGQLRALAVTTASPVGRVAGHSDDRQTSCRVMRPAALPASACPKTPRPKSSPC